MVTANGKPAVLLSINRQPDSNTVRSRRMKSTRKSKAFARRFPRASNSAFFTTSPTSFANRLAACATRSSSGCFLTGFIIWLFLRDLGTALMAGLVMPVAICVTFIAMKILGQSFNMMTLGGLAAAGGLVIDDAIVVVENIVLHRDGGEGPLEATSSALKELTVPLIGSTLTPIVVFLPLISITGVTGTFFRALAIAMSVSLLTSLVLALSMDDQPGHTSDPPQETPEASCERETRVRPKVRTAIWDADPARILRDFRSGRNRRMMAAEEASLRGGMFEQSSFLRALAAPRSGASGLAGRFLRDSDRYFLCLLTSIWAATCFPRWMKADSFSTT